MFTKFLSCSLLAVCLPIIALAQQASVPTEDLYVMNASHDASLIADHAAMIEKLTADGITVITADTEITVEAETRIAFDWAISSGQNYDFSKVPRTIKITKLHPSVTQGEDGKNVTRPQKWVIKYKDGTAAAVALD